MDWISIEDELPPQSYDVIALNGKAVVYYAAYYRKKWYSWDKRLHKVTHWKYFEGRKPSIPPKDLKAFFLRAEKYKQQMEKKEFRMGPIKGLYHGGGLTSQSAESFLQEMQNPERW